jgi:hypothetical protein
VADSRALPLFRTQLAKREDVLLEVLDLFLRSHPPEVRPPGEANPGIELGATVIAIRRKSADPAAKRPKSR